MCVPCWLWHLTTEEKAAYCLKLPMRIWLWYNIQHLWAREASAAEYPPWKENSSKMCQIMWEQTGKFLPDTVTETLLWGGSFFNPEWEVQNGTCFCPCTSVPKNAGTKEVVPLVQQAEESSATSIGTGECFFDEVGTLPWSTWNICYFIFRKYKNLPTFSVLVLQCPHVHTASEMHVSPFQCPSIFWRHKEVSYAGSLLS